MHHAALEARRTVTRAFDWLRLAKGALNIPGSKYFFPYEDSQFKQCQEIFLGHEVEDIKVSPCPNNTKMPSD